jgi:hypothetical protein
VLNGLTLNHITESGVVRREQDLDILIMPLEIRHWTGLVFPALRPGAGFAIAFIVAIIVWSRVGTADKCCAMRQNPAMSLITFVSGAPSSLIKSEC